MRPFLPEPVFCEISAKCGLRFRSNSSSELPVGVHCPCCFSCGSGAAEPQLLRCVVDIQLVPNFDQKYTPTGQMLTKHGSKIRVMAIALPGFCAAEFSGATMQVPFHSDFPLNSGVCGPKRYRMVGKQNRAAEGCATMR